MKMGLLKKVGLLAMTVALCAGCGKTKPTADSLAADWPTKSVNMIVPWNAGGDTDIYARILAKNWGINSGRLLW